MHNAIRTNQMRQTRLFFLVLTTIVLLSCDTNTEVKTSIATSSDKTENTPDFNVALNFINDYVAFSSVKPTIDTNWITNNSSLTDNFKSKYSNLLDSAYKVDHELGLDFDPIFDAQDFPDKGFEISKFDNTTGYITVKGKAWKEFELVLKIVFQDNKWLVDGSGVINIPVDKRANR